MSDHISDHAMRIEQLEVRFEEALQRLTRNVDAVATLSEAVKGVIASQETMARTIGKQEEDLQRMRQTLHTIANNSAEVSLSVREMKNINDRQLEILEGQVKNHTARFSIADKIIITIVLAMAAAFGGTIVNRWMQGGQQLDRIEHKMDVEK